MTAKLYGIGVGPGDFELITLKAIRIMRESDVIAVPGEDYRQSMAYRIARKAYPEISEKKTAGIPMPMTKDKKVLEESHLKGTKILREYLDAGQQVAFLTLGDPTVYSTYIYLHKGILDQGYDAQIVSGVPSFCAAAARLNIGLAENAEQIHIIPASYGVEEALAYPGTKVLMKAGKRFQEVREALLQKKAEAAMVENCGMEDEHIFKQVEDMPKQAGYYSLTIVKDEREEREGR